MNTQTFKFINFKGDEPFTLNGEPVGLSMSDFWSFQYSNIWDTQQEVAEFIVAKALGQDVPYNKNGWTLWDMNYRGKKVEIKETAYYHSWRTDGKVSALRTFGIEEAYTRYKDKTSTLKRQSDVYVFCLNTGNTQEESHPMKLENWRFWVVPTTIINEVCGKAKRISLERVKKITRQPNGIGYMELRAAVDQYC